MLSILEVQHLVKKYGGFAAVDNVSFAIEATQPDTPATVQSGGDFAQSSPGQMVTWALTTLFGVAGFLVHERVNGAVRCAWWYNCDNFAVKETPVIKLFA